MDYKNVCCSGWSVGRIEADPPPVDMAEEDTRGIDVLRLSELSHLC